MDSRPSPNKVAPSNSSSKSTARSTQPSMTQKGLKSGLKLFESMIPSGHPSVRFPASSKLPTGSGNSAYKSGNVSSKKKNLVSASPTRFESLPGLSSLVRPRTATGNRLVAPSSASSKQKSTVPSVPVSVAKRGVSGSNRPNSTRLRTKSQGVSVAKSGIPPKTSSHPVMRANTSSKRTTTRQKGRSVHIHHHHHVVMEPRAHHPHPPIVACRFCRCDIDDTTYEERGYCFDCGKTIHG